MKVTTGAVIASLIALSFVAVVFLVVFLGSEKSIMLQVDYVNPWSYRCEGQGTTNARCVKEEAVTLPGNTLNHCKLICGEHSTVWPATSVPAAVGTEVFRFIVSEIYMTYKAPDDVTNYLDQNWEIFLNHLHMYHPDYDINTRTAPWTVPTDRDILDNVVNVQITVKRSGNTLSLTTDESYTLNIENTTNEVTVMISANTFFGARHAIATLSQIMNYDDINGCLQIINEYEVTDKPAYPYRGLILDTSRSFIPIESIKRTIETMGTVKLNTFHWHITDSHSFPIVMESLPKMHQYGAYSGRALYYPSDIQEIVEYGRVRGVRVLPEFDAPAHVGSGWTWGPQDGLGNLAVCVNKEPWWTYCYEPPCGQLNIANEKMYTVLSSVYQEFVDAFGQLDLFHYGGDEVNIPCWNSTPEVVDWMTLKENGSLSKDAYIEQWSIFQNKAYDLLNAANDMQNATGILWTSALTMSPNVEQYLSKEKYIIQIWTPGNDTHITDLLDMGYKVIFSNYDAWYLDCGFSAWVGEGLNWCTPYKGWQTVYDNNPRDLVANPAYDGQILGGEAALWTEQTDERNMDAKLWPRLSALAERLWTNPPHNWEPALYRMVHHRELLVMRGVDAEVIQPEWCHQNDGGCPAWGEY